ncbi:hypothetical protein ACFFRR_000524 [Megaselia abdita]
MTKNPFSSVCLALLSVFRLVHCQHLQSPCPGLFQYASDGIENYGLIYFNGAQIGQTYFLDLQMTVQGRLPTSFYGQISLIEGKEATLRNIIQNKPVVYKVTFPVRNQLPEVSVIRINNNLICSGRNSLGGSVTKLSLQHTLQTTGQIPLSYQPSTLSQSFSQPNSIQNFPGFTNYVDPRLQRQPQLAPTRPQPQIVTQSPVLTQPQLSPQTQVSPQLVAQPTVSTRSQAPQSSASIVNQICGTAAVIPRPLVIGGQTIPRGSWPWLVAVYLNDARGLSFKCGGNLVSSRTVITAAHCLKLRGVEHKPKNILIVAGRHNLLDWSESTSITFNAERVAIHPDYKDSLQSFDGDIAIIIVKQTIR